jgi:hypothetical protein
MNETWRNYFNSSTKALKVKLFIFSQLDTWMKIFLFIDYKEQLSFLKYFLGFH